MEGCVEFFRVEFAIRYDTSYEPVSLFSDIRQTFMIGALWYATSPLKYVSFVDHFNLKYFMITPDYLHVMSKPVRTT